MDKISKENFVEIVEGVPSTKIEDIIILLEQIYNAEIETVEDVCSLELKFKKIILTCIDLKLIFLSNDDRLLMTEYGQICFLKLHQKYNI